MVYTTNIVVNVAVNNVVLVNKQQIPSGNIYIQKPEGVEQRNLVIKVIETYRNSWFIACFTRTTMFTMMFTMMLIYHQSYRYHVTKFCCSKPSSF